MLSPNIQNQFYQQHVQLLLDSYEKLLGEPLITIENSENLSECVFNADFALLSHDTQSPPVFNYANQTGLALFEFSWDELIKTPSYYSAEPENREKREELLAQVSKFGFINNYNGIRITKYGKRFEIKNAIVWNVYDEMNVYYGQAATFKNWRFL